MDARRVLSAALTVSALRAARFREHVNHGIAKEIVANAERSRSAIAIEDLRHIRKRVNAAKAQRSRLHGSFAELCQFTTDKAKLAGIPVVAIDPPNTRPTCPECGVIEMANRKSEAAFPCMHCGDAAAVDFVAHRNIRVAGARCH